VIGKIVIGAKGEEVFSERMGLFFKSIAVRRIHDRTNDTSVYIAYSRQVKDASAKMGLSTIALFNANATWSTGKS
jgi:CreA protein